MVSAQLLFVPPNGNRRAQVLFEPHLKPPAEIAYPAALIFEWRDIVVVAVADEDVVSEAGNVGRGRQAVSLTRDFGFFSVYHSSQASSRGFPG